MIGRNRENGEEEVFLGEEEDYLLESRKLEGSIREAKEEIVVQQAAVKTLSDELDESNVRLDYYNSLVNELNVL